MKHEAISPDETRSYITNRAREELTHEQHDAVYDKLEALLTPNKDWDGPPKNWAQHWLMVIELKDLGEGEKTEDKT